MWFEATNPKDSKYLSQFEVWGGIPQKPVCLPGLGRYGRYQFDQQLLLQRSDLTVAQKKEVIFLCEHFHKLDHFEFFELKATQNLKEIKKAYFRFSKRFHPDSLKGKNLGVLSEHLPLLFQYGQYIYKLLVDDSEFLTVYSRVTKERDLAFRNHLEEQRTLMHQQVGARQKQRQDPIAPHKRRSEDEINKRKEYLRDRLSKNQQKRNQVSKGEQNQQAKLFYQEGLQAEKRQLWTRAFNHFKLAVDYMPQNSDYQESLTRVRQQLALQEARQVWEKAQTWVDTEMFDKALPIHTQSLDIAMDEERVTEFYNYYHDKNPTDCLIWLNKACIQWIHNLEFKWMYIQVLIKESDFKKAMTVAEEILSFDPSEPRALKFMKQYKDSK